MYLGEKASLYDKTGYGNDKGIEITLLNRRFSFPKCTTLINCICYKHPKHVHKMQRCTESN